MGLRSRLKLPHYTFGLLRTLLEGMQINLSHLHLFCQLCRSYAKTLGFTLCLSSTVIRLLCSLRGTVQGRGNSSSRPYGCIFGRPRSSQVFSALCKPVPQLGCHPRPVCAPDLLYLGPPSGQFL